MGKKADFNNLHRVENVNRWEWKSEGSNRIVAVPREGEYALAREMKSYNMEAAVWAFMGLLCFLLMIIGDMIILAQTHDSPAKAIPAAIVYTLVSGAWGLMLTKKSNKVRNEERPLFALRVPYRDSRDDGFTKVINGKFTNILTEFLNETKGQANGTIPLGGKYMSSQNLARTYYEIVTQFLRGGSGDTLDFLSSTQLIERIDDTVNHRHDRLVEMRTNSLIAGETPLMTKAATADNLNMTVPLTSALAHRGGDTLALFERLAAEHKNVEELSTAAKRWASLSEKSRSDLLVIAAEITPILSMVKEARELGRSKFLSDAETTLEEIIALGEATAERMNRELDQMNLDNIAVRHIFLQDKFHANSVNTDPITLTK